MKKTIVFILLAAAPLIALFEVCWHEVQRCDLECQKRRTGSSFRELYRDNAPDQEGGEG